MKYLAALVLCIVLLGVPVFTVYATGDDILDIEGITGIGDGVDGVVDGQGIGVLDPDETEEDEIGATDSGEEKPSRFMQFLPVLFTGLAITVAAAAFIVMMGYVIKTNNKYINHRERCERLLEDADMTYNAQCALVRHLSVLMEDSRRLKDKNKAADNPKGFGGGFLSTSQDPIENSAVYAQYISDINKFTRLNADIRSVYNEAVAEFNKFKRRFPTCLALKVMGRSCQRTEYYKADKNIDFPQIMRLSPDDLLQTPLAGVAIRSVEDSGQMLTAEAADYEDVEAVEGAEYAGDGTMFPDVTDEMEEVEEEEVEQGDVLVRRNFGDNRAVPLQTVVPR